VCVCEREREREREREGERERETYCSVRNVFPKTLLTRYSRENVVVAR